MDGNFYLFRCITIVALVSHSMLIYSMARGVDAARKYP